MKKIPMDHPRVREEWTALRSDGIVWSDCTSSGILLNYIVGDKEVFVEVRHPPISRPHPERIIVMACDFRCHYLDTGNIEQAGEWKKFADEVRAFNPRLKK